MNPGESATVLHVDWTRCRGRGGCTELLPELMERDDWGLPVLRTDGRGGTDVAVPADLDADARQAVRDCPRMALRLISRPS